MVMANEYGINRVNKCISTIAPQWKGQVLTRLLILGQLQRQHMLLQPPAPHALSGYDTIAQCFGVGKCTITKVLRSGVALHKLGAIPEDLDDVTKEATVFMAACYGVKNFYFIKHA